MKAKIKATGEIVRIADYARITLDEHDSWGNPIELKPEEIELIQEVSEDGHWTSVRERAAIAAIHAILSNTGNKVYQSSLDIISKNAVTLADELVKQLKGE